MKAKKLPLLLLLVALVPTLSFKSLVLENQYLIAVGIAYRDMDCNGLTVKTAFACDAVTSIGGKISDLRTQVQNEVARENAIDSRNVIVKTGYKSNAVIISYQKNISGWGCDKTIYAVGFGETFDQAKNDAISKKEVSNASHTVVRHITVN